MKSRISLLLFSFLIILQACNEDNSKAEVIDDQPSLNESDKREYVARGREIAKQTFITLSTQLKAKISEGGIQNAVDYCNVAAYPLTDSIAKANNVVLRRATDRYRNPGNKADSLESIVLDEYKKNVNEGLKLEARIIEDGGVVHFYAPIKTKGLCLSCHGEPGKFISEADYAFIKEKYPKDLAINYESDELRGIWSITFLDE